MNKKKKILYGLAVVILLLIIAGLIRKNSGKTVEQTYEEMPVTVRVSRAETHDIKETLTAAGSIKPFSEVVVYSKTTGVVERIFVVEGQYVKKGEIVAQVDYTKSEITIKQLESQVKAAEANLSGLKRDYERMQKLYSEGVISQKKWDDIQTAYDVAMHNLDGLKAQLSLAKVHLEDTRVVAPISGTVMKKFIDEGEFITDASMMKNAPLVTIADISRVKIVASVAEVELGRIGKGKKAEVRVDAYPEKVFYGEVYKISPFVDPITRTVEVEILVDNNSQLLKPGMFARSTIILRTHKNAFVVPEKAVFKEEDKSYVLVVDDFIVKKREVKTGMVEDGYIEITEGLSGGEKVVVEGGIGLEDGTKVEVAE
ncbi:MAG: efflux RND transporter periplasmic adaptor subunit [Candidatus Omnitrophica bacterium]|nr:efflux RND transporter periplasmic adaptor subunit [Candidatus Omnitrophota bacterium]